MDRTSVESVLLEKVFWMCCGSHFTWIEAMCCQNYIKVLLFGRWGWSSSHCRFCVARYHLQSSELILAFLWVSDSTRISVSSWQKLLTALMQIDYWGVLQHTSVHRNMQGEKHGYSFIHGLDRLQQRNVPASQLSGFHIQDKHLEFLRSYSVAGNTCFAYLWHYFFGLSNGKVNLKPALDLRPPQGVCEAYRN